MIARVRIARRLLGKEKRPDHFIANDERHDQLNLSARETVVVDLNEGQDLGLGNFDRIKTIRQKLSLVFVSERESEWKLIAEAACGDHLHRMLEPRVARDAASHYPKRSKQQMQRGAHGLVKVVAVRDFLTQLRKRAERMDELALRLSHLPELCCLEFLNFQFLSTQGSRASSLPTSRTTPRFPLSHQRKLFSRPFRG